MKDDFDNISLDFQCVWINFVIKLSELERNRPRQYNYIARHVYVHFVETINSTIGHQVMFNPLWDNLCMRMNACWRLYTSWVNKNIIIQF